MRIELKMNFSSYGFTYINFWGSIQFLSLLVPAALYLSCKAGNLMFSCNVAVGRDKFLGNFEDKLILLYAYCHIY